MEKKWTYLACAGVAGALVALIGCGNDPGAAGASGTRPPFGGARDGGNGTDDGNTGGPNPLIAKIPGFWYGEMFDGQPNPGLEQDMSDPDEVVVDADDPACAKWVQKAPAVIADRSRNTWTNMNPPGDACIRAPTWANDGLEPIFFIILDGDEVRRSDLYGDVAEQPGVFGGTVTEDGRTIEVTYTCCGRTSLPSRYRKIR